jgi:sucrose-6-phosphate hydrolase SacC (GH32 family)
MNQASSKKAADIYQTTQYETSLKDKTYPKYHLRAPSGWVNDPCGLFYFNSSFHVFMQSNPWGKNWGDMSWSHLVSDPSTKGEFKWFYPTEDNALKVTAIIPSLDERAADRNGIITGCIKTMPYKNQDDTISYYPTAFYSAVWGCGEATQETVCIARALDANKVSEDGKIVDPHLTDWTKYSKDENEDLPEVVLRQPEELNLVSFRDPFIFNLPDDDNFYMLMSAGKIDNTPKGVVLCFKNDGNDITKNWVRANSADNFFFEGDVFVKDDVSRSGDFECVIMYRLTDHVGAMNDTPYILIFAQDGSAEGDYGRSLYHVLGDIVKTQSSIRFEPLNTFKDNNGKPIYRLLDLSPDFIIMSPDKNTN